MNRKTLILIPALLSILPSFAQAANYKLGKQLAAELAYYAPNAVAGCKISVISEGSDRFEYNDAPVTISARDARGQSSSIVIKMDDRIPFTQASFSSPIIAKFNDGFHSLSIETTENAILSLSVNQVHCGVLK